MERPVDKELLPQVVKMNGSSDYRVRRVTGAFRVDANVERGKRDAVAG